MAPYWGLAAPYGSLAAPYGGLQCLAGLFGGHRGSLYEVWEVYWDPMGVIRGRLFEVYELLRRFWMIEGLI